MGQICVVYVFFVSCLAIYPLMQMQKSVFPLLMREIADAWVTEKAPFLLLILLASF